MVFLFASRGPDSFSVFIILIFVEFVVHSSEKKGHCKTKRKQKCRKKRTNKSVSAIVFTKNVP